MEIFSKVYWITELAARRMAGQSYLCNGKITGDSEAESRYGDCDEDVMTEFLTHGEWFTTMNWRVPDRRCSRAKARCR